MHYIIDMPKSTSISARIDPLVKTKAEKVFHELGLTASQAITLFYRQVDLKKGLPFPVEIPTAETLKAVAEARESRGIRSFESADNLFQDLGI